MAFFDGAGGGLLGGIGAIFQNDSNAKQARKDREFQANMSSTAHQREVKDLVAAGLNPILSATGGASTPSGAQAQAENVGSAAVSSAAEAKNLALAIERQAQEIKNLKATENKTNTETKILSRGLPKAELEGEAYKFFLQPIIDKFKDSNQRPKTQSEQEYKNKTFYQRLLTNPLK